MTMPSADAEPTQTDLELLDRVRAGSEPALVVLFDRYSKVVYAVALRVLRDTTLAEDVMQDVFLKLWKDTPRLDARSHHLLGWFGVLARNRAIDLLRRQHPSEVLEGVAMPSTVDVETEAESHILYDRARSIIVTLPEAQQSVLQLAFFEGLSHSEIATRLQTPLGTIKTRIRQALLTVRKAAGV
jgi:RNA polymerase sigma-70 factor, ECF subfamily